MEILFLLGLGKLKANWLYSLPNILLPPKVRDANNKQVH